MKIKKYAQVLSWLCLAASFVCLVAVYCNRLDAEEVFSGVRLVWCRQDQLLLTSAGGLALLSGVCAVCSRRGKRIWYCAAFAALLLCFAWLGTPILRDHEEGTLAEAVDRHVSPQATIKKAMMTAVPDGRILTAQMEEEDIRQLEQLLERCGYSACAPDSIFRSQWFDSASPYDMPAVRIEFQGQEDRSQTYYLTLYCDNPDYGVVDFYTSSELRTLTLCRWDSPELYQFLQHRQDRLVPWA